MMNFFSQFQARMQQFSARMSAHFRHVTANIPHGESGVWVNGQKVSSLPNLPIATQTTVSNGHVVTRTVSLADSIASFRSEGGVSVIQFGGGAMSPESMISRGH